MISRASFMALSYPLSMDATSREMPQGAVQTVGQKGRTTLWVVHFATGQTESLSENSSENPIVILTPRSGGRISCLLFGGDPSPASRDQGDRFVEGFGSGLPFRRCPKL
jgi:hypothetical protein